MRYWPLYVTSARIRKQSTDPCQTSPNMTNTRRDVLRMLRAITFAKLAVGNETSSAVGNSTVFACPQELPPTSGQTVAPHFPALAQPINGKSLIYFDTAATAQRPQAVID